MRWKYEKENICFFLTLRVVIYKVLLLSTIFLAIHSLFFLTGKTDYNALHSSLVNIIASLHMKYFAGIYLFILFAILMSGAAGKTSKSSYTIKRLGISENTFFIIESFTNFLMICFAFITITFGGFICCCIYEGWNGNFFSTGPVFLSFLHSIYFQNFFPMFDILRTLRNIIFIISTSFCLSEADIVIRKGGKPVLGILASVLPVIYCMSVEPEIDEIIFDVVIIATSVITCALAIDEALRGCKYEK